MTAGRTWFITGVSRGLGRALAEALLTRGETVVGTTRDGRADLIAPPGRLQLLPLELSDAEGIDAAVSRAFKISGRVDVIVNNAGYAVLGALEHATDEQIKRLFAVNVFGPLRLIRAALPRLRAQGHGHIVNITSVQGVDPGAGVGLYAATKAAMDAMSAALALEVAPLGLNVTAVVPGGMRTDFLSDHSLERTFDQRDDGYAESVGVAIERFARADGQQLGDPERAAAAIIAAVDAEAPPHRLLLGSDAIDRANRMAGEVAAEQERWKALSLSTDISR